MWKFCLHFSLLWTQDAGIIWAQGQGDNVFNVDAIWKCLMQGLYIPNMSTVPCLDHKLQANQQTDST